MSTAVALADVGFAYASSARRTRGRSKEDRAAAATRGLSSCSLEIPAGSYVALTGANGAGKTTLLRILATELLAASGRVEVLGRHIDSTTAAGQLRGVRAGLGVVRAEPSLDAVLTVVENLRLAAALHGRAVGRAALEEALAAAGLSGRGSDRVGVLSTGLRRRADLTRALIHGPSLLLLDEPTAGLDAAGRRDFLDAIDSARAAEPGLTVVTASHDDAELRRAGRLIALAGGRVVADAQPEAIAERLGAFVLDSRDRSIADAVRAIGLRPVEHAGGLLASVQDRAQADAVLGAIEGGGWRASLRRPMMQDAGLLLAEGGDGP